jgi:HlyD family secretion protein
VEVIADKMTKFMARESFDKWLTNIKTKKWLTPASLLASGVFVFLTIWQYSLATEKNNLIKANGRIEATEFSLAPRTSARVKEILVHEGEYVNAGQILVYMDTDVMEAQLKEVRGRLLQAHNSVSVNQSRLIQRKSEKTAAEAVLQQHEAELEVAEKRWARSLKLVSEGATSQQTADDDWAAYKSAIAAKEVACAQIKAADAAILTAQEEVVGAESAVEAARGNVERIEADIKDSELKAPRDGRVQYLVAQQGEVVAAGSPVLTLVDLSDVYMIFFLPTAEAGRLSIGEEVRIILDAAPKHVIPANISFVSDIAQFTPKTVETTSEREKLMFRVKAQIPRELLQKYITYVKTGLTGKAYIRRDPAKKWPNSLKVNI